MAPTVAELVDRARNNEIEAFQLLAERYKRKIYYTVLSVVGNHHDAEDLLQDTLLQALRSIDRLRHPEGFGSWVLRIAFNKSIDLRRRRRKEAAPEIDKDGTEVFDLMENPDAKGNPERNLASEQISTLVSRTMDELPESQRTAFAMKHIAQLSIREIAAATKSSEATVKTNIYRAVQKMRKVLLPLVKKGSGVADEQAS
ncbi:MAG TPA: sigma-70 family RNA polymerase sigma factor [Acidobacteriota bacterium]|nr:sigma-70 family RNA polymerase sigma factor [Acidobacteriota bacterium]